MPQRRDSRLWSLSGVFVFLGLFSLFLSTFSPSIYLDDSGETVTVATLLGIGHPPGYPLHSLLGHVWLSAVRLGSLDGRLNLMAALLGTLTGTLLFLWLSRGRTLGHAIVVLAVVLLYVGGPVYWHNALGAKGSIYQLNNLLSVALLALLTWDAELSVRRVRAFWLVAGLAAAHHFPSQIILGPALAWLLLTQPGPGSRWRRWTPAWLALPGLSLYLYFFIRSAWQPGLNWGNVHDLHSFLFFVGRGQYASAEGVRSLATSWREGHYALMLLFKEGSYLVLPMALASFWLLRRERLVQGLAMTWAMMMAVIMLFLDLPPERLVIIGPFLFPAYLAQTVMAAVGATALWQHFKPGLPRSALAGVGLVIAVGAVGLGYAAQDLSNYHYADDSARNILRELPPHAVVFAQGDAIIFPLWYEQRVRGLRPDVAVIGNSVLPLQWVRQDLARWHPDVKQPDIPKDLGAEYVTRLIFDLVQRNAAQHPIYLSYNKLDPPMPGWHLVSEGLVYRLVRNSEPMPKDIESVPRQRFQTAVIRGYTKRPLDDHTLSIVVGDFAILHNSIGVSLEEAGRFEAALGWYRQAEKIHPESPEFPFNQGNALHALKRLPEASHAFARALTKDPDYQPALYNAAATYLQLGHRDEAVAALLHLLHVAPERDDLRQLLQRLGVNAS